jgi:hypothetical protein
MRIPSARRTLRGMLTRRQLLVRGGGATVALACFGALPGGAVAGPAALSGTHAETYVAILELINADPAYELADRLNRARRFAEIYAGADDAFREYADTALDEFAQGRLTAAALDLAALPYRDDPDDKTIRFTLS